MNNLTKRLLTGIILATIILLLVNTAYGFVLLVMAIDILGVLEFYRLFTSAACSPRKAVGITLAISLILTLALALNKITGWYILFVNVPLIFMIYFFELYLKAPNPFVNIAFTFLGIVYITVPLCFFTALAFFQFPSVHYHHELIMGCLLMLWAGDTGAFLVGKYLGTHHLFERISPNKTWEGSISGAVSTAFVAIVLSHYFTIFDRGTWLSLALIIIFTGTYGDFFKSMLKRSLNIKDSGTILPGHGGILDRFDSLLGSAPFVYSYMVLIWKP